MRVLSTKPTGRSVAWQRACFGSTRSWVRIPPPRPTCRCWSARDASLPSRRRVRPSRLGHDPRARCVRGPRRRAAGDHRAGHVRLDRRHAPPPRGRGRLLPRRPHRPRAALRRGGERHPGAPCRDGGSRSGLAGADRRRDRPHDRRRRGTRTTATRRTRRSASASPRRSTTGPTIAARCAPRSRASASIRRRSTCGTSPSGTVACPRSQRPERSRRPPEAGLRAVSPDGPSRARPRSAEADAQEVDPEGRRDASRWTQSGRMAASHTARGTHR